MGNTTKVVACQIVENKGNVFSIPEYSRVHRY